MRPMTDTEPRPTLSISNRYYGATIALSSFISSVLLLTVILSATASGYLFLEKASVPRTLMIVLAVALASWAMIVTLVFSLTRVVLSIQFGADVTYRCLFRRRSLPWSEIARVYVREGDEAQPNFLSGLLRLDDELVLVRTNGT